jgi:DNA-binding transcriptional LysR family regulator
VVVVTLLLCRRTGFRGDTTPLEHRGLVRGAGQEQQICHQDHYAGRNDGRHHLSNEEHSGAQWRLPGAGRAMLEFSLMDLRQIMYFMCVYEEGSFTKAARKLGLVQPALSVQVKRLEEEFGVALFQRTLKGVVPTASGRSFYDLCAPIRRSVGAARQQMLEQARPDQVFGVVRGGFLPTFFKALLGPVIVKFIERYPGVDLTVREAYGGTLKDWVASGNLDFALGAWFDDESLEHSVIYEEDVALVCGAPIAGESLQACDLGTIPDLKLMLPSANHVLGRSCASISRQGCCAPPAPWSSTAIWASWRSLGRRIGRCLFR